MEDKGVSLDTENFSHREAMEIVKNGLTDIIQNDVLLHELPDEVTEEEVKSQIALELGQAMTVFVKRADGETMAVVVTLDADVWGLKQAVERHVMLSEARRRNDIKVSWKYVWKRHWLYFDGQKLTDNHKLLGDYGITNKCEVTFIRRLRST